MSLSFDGVDDVVTSGNITLGQLFTITAWINPSAFGETSKGVVVQHGSGNDNARINFRVENNTATSTFALVVARGTGNGRHVAPANTVVLNQWQQIAVTYNGSDDLNDPLLYYNGQPVTATEQIQPNGVMQADNQPLYIGNNNTTARTYAGLIGEVAIWSRIFTPVEIADAYVEGVNALPDYAVYAPLDSGRLQEFRGLTLTPTGAVAGENPPIRPAGRRG